MKQKWGFDLESFDRLLRKIGLALKLDDSAECKTVGCSDFGPGGIKRGWVHFHPHWYQYRIGKRVR